MMWHPDMPLEYRDAIVTGDARVLAERIPDKSVDLIFTDPPYPEKFLYCYAVLALSAFRCLTDSGMLLTYSGNQFTDRVMAMMCERLRFFWIGWINHPSSQQRVWHKNVWCGGKPLLMFSKEGALPHDWICDTTISTRDKRYHDWGQGENVATYYIDKLTTPGQVVLDLFCGGGTVPAVCKMLGRHYVAFEIDPATAESARQRVANTQPPLFVPEPEQMELAL